MEVTNGSPKTNEISNEVAFQNIGKITNDDKLTTMSINNRNDAKNTFIENSNRFMYENEKSPDLFEDDDEIDEPDEIPSVLHGSENNNTSFDDISLLKCIEKRDHEILQRIQISLSGLPPPPSVTILQIDMCRTLATCRKQIFNFFDDYACANNEENCKNTLFKPSHSYAEINNMKWPNILNANHFGLCYNLSPTTEKIEQLGLAVVDRYVGSETSSSFIYYSPSRAKIRNKTMRIQSPGSRLSHLAKRRAIFSSTHLESSLQMSQQLNACTRQILLDSTKTESRKSSLKSGRNNTVKSRTTSARNVLVEIRPSTAGPSRETSKRVLFQSPHNEKLFVPKIPFKSDIVNPIDKSKRALFFSPDSSDVNSRNSKQFPIQDCNGIVSGSLKRKRCDDEEKQYRDELLDNRMSRSLRFKSQSFCIGSANSAPNITEVNGTSLFRTSSSSATFNCSGFSESHKKKLLWAVSQALLHKQIGVDHPKFKQYASVLARAVKRIFLEKPAKCGSASDIMLSLAKKYVIFVINGKTTDEVYLHEKDQMKNLHRIGTKITGYITPDDYEKCKNSLKRSTSSVLFSEPAQSLIGCNQLNSNAKGFELTKQISLDVSVKNSMPDESQPIQSDKTLQNSSSKNNLNGIALRENFDSDQKRRSVQKYYGEKDTSPYSDCVQLSLKKLTARICDTNGSKAKRVISFDN